MKREGLFWLLFALLNFVLFVPAFVLNGGESSFFPGQVFQQWSPVAIGKGLLYNRTNLDIFRISVEFSLLLFAVYFFRKRHWQSFFAGLLFAVYLLLLSYQLYHQLFLALYQTPPFFFNDVGLLKVGWANFSHDFGWRYGLYLLALLLICGVLFVAVRQLVRGMYRINFSRISLGLMLFLLLESVVIAFRWGYKSWPEHVPQFQVAAIAKNIRESAQARRNMAQLDVEKLLAYHPYDTIDLPVKPNLFLLFVESYGRIMYDEKALRDDYEKYLPELEKDLQAKGWYSSSVLSKAPVSGGASWVSYATLMDGFDLRNRGTYWALLQDSSFYQYQHLTRMLQGKGYRNYRLSAIGGGDDMKIPWDTYSRFYAVDEWIMNGDFGYKGLLYGWGPSPPDQFSLHFANDYIRRQRKVTEPFTLFFITQNSHNPFVSPEAVADDWRSLNDTLVDQVLESRLFEKPNLANYARAIRYQLDYLTDFVEKAGQENDLFIIVGDHQPPFFPQAGAGFETPLHIIGRDSALVKSFEDFGFDPGMLIRHTDRAIKHEGVYSLIMNRILSRYLPEGTEIPRYLPEGLVY